MAGKAKNMENITNSRSWTIHRLINVTLFGNFARSLSGLDKLGQGSNGVASRSRTLWADRLREPDWVTGSHKAQEWNIKPEREPEWARESTSESERPKVSMIDKGVANVSQREQEWARVSPKKWKKLCSDPTPAVYEALACSLLYIVEKCSSHLMLFIAPWCFIWLKSNWSDK